jgi:ubiquinone/menaquinone biosynthesis C-methylase UbiE
MDKDIENFYVKFFLDLPVGAPGSEVSTRKAYSYLKNLPENPKILDIGCFTGTKTIELARLSKGKIIAIDILQPFLEKLKENAKDSGVADNLEALNKSMFSMDFDDESFDVIWCDSAVYNYGFEKALIEWRRFLKKGGYMIISEVAWIKDDPPEIVRKFWEEEYPSMKSNEENLEIIEKQEYELVTSFFVDKEDLWNYYTPFEKKTGELVETFSDSPEYLKLLESFQREVEIFKKYSDYYGFIFYVMQN